MKSLVIVESPAKARTLNRYLGSNFEVKSSVGHIKDLPERTLGVDIEEGFEPQYKVIRGKSKVVKELRDSARKADHIYLAPDPDREGEAIAWHIAEEIAKGDHESDGRIHRVLFNEITKQAVQEAIAHPQALNRSLFEAQQARRVLDRLVGYQISPLLWKKVRRGLSAGRVQSVAVRIICEREQAIRACEKVEYWTIDARFQAGDPPPFPAGLARIGKTAVRTPEVGKQPAIPDETEARRIEKDLRDRLFRVAKITRKEKSRRPAPPFITSTLQQEAARKLGFSASRTMRIAQQLYEGLELGAEGHVGLITYMRTDSPRISPVALGEAREYIKGRYGDDYLPAKAQQYRGRKSAQDAHEGVRPTSAARTPDSVRSSLTAEQARLYELIWKRFLASQMKPARFYQTSVDIEALETSYLLRASGSKLIFDGFLTLYREGRDEGDPEDERETMLPDLNEGDELRLLHLEPKQHFTQPPPRFTEASLVRELEEKGVGRPSTYAAIMSNIVAKDYVQLENRHFLPTTLGETVNDLLVKSFPEILNIAFTAAMEDNLDRIEEKQSDWREVLKEFYGPFSEALKNAEEVMQRQVEETEILCPKCGAETGARMVVRWGKRGRFLACSSYPKCNAASDFETAEDGTITMKEPEVSEETCPKCGKPMILRRGRYGEFLACSDYPECRGTKNIGRDGRVIERSEPEDSGEKCDKCGGRMLIKVARAGNKFLSCENYPKCKNAKPLPLDIDCPREGCGGRVTERRYRGRIFYGCTEYPKCDFRSSYKPVNQPCPECGSSYLVEVTTKDEGTELRCPEKKCGYSQKQESAA